MTGGEAARLTPPLGARDHAQGPSDAPVTLVEYGDYECPYCRAAAPIAQELQRLLGDQLRYAYRHYPLSTVHPRAQRAAEAAEAAGAQGHFWAMHALLFERQDALGDEELAAYAAELGLDADQFARDLAERRHAARVREDLASGDASGVAGTPTFFLDGVRYDRQVGLRPFLAAIREAHPNLVLADDPEVSQRLIPRVVGQRSRPRPPG